MLPDGGTAQGARRRVVPCPMRSRARVSGCVTPGWFRGLNGRAVRPAIGTAGWAAYPAGPARAGRRRRHDLGQQAAGADRRTRRPAGHRAAPQARRAAQRAGPDHLQGQGPDPGHPPARRRSARAQRHARGELADERGRPADRGRRLLRQPHRDRAVQAHPADRRHPGGYRPFRPGRRRDHRRRRADAGRVARGTGHDPHRGPASGRGRQVGHLAGGKGPPANEAAGYPPRRSSTRCLGTCRTTPSSPSMSATTPTRWAGTWNPAASRY